MADPIPNLGNPNDQSLKEYVVTLKNFKDADVFYADMETTGCGLHDALPDRSIECINRRPISRNTHYLMTYDEAAVILNDPRVLAVELNPADRGLVRGTCSFEQTSTEFSKAVASSSTDINWGLLRCLRESDISNWGATGTVKQSGTVVSDSSGKNVDVVIMDDGTPYPTVLEYKQNSDGTGYTRMVEYNWFQHNPVVTGGSAGVYSYPENRLQQHGAHTTGTVAGNTQGWARDANIYNLTFYNSIDYVREFHKNKPINPLTGVKNPTVMNNSWGYRSSQLLSAYISKLTIRGVDYFPTSGAVNGTYVWDSNVLQNIARLNIGGAFPARDTATDTDMIEAMTEGIIIVASAGNSYFYQDVVGGLDYNNTMIYAGNTLYIHRGSSPGAADGGTEDTKIICSGAIGQHDEASGASIYASTAIQIGDYKAEFSNYGPRIDCYAPGSGIQSIWAANNTLYDSNNTVDSRVAALGLTDTINNNFKKCPGTSMSGPQTAGVLACLAEKYPRMTQADARAYIKYASPSTVLSSNGGAQDPKDAGTGFNATSNIQMLALRGTRHPTADVGGYYSTPFPSSIEKHRPPTGQVYPRKNTTNSFNKQATFSLASNHASRTNGQIATITLSTSNVPNGTAIQYLITAKPSSGSAVLTATGFSGVYTTDTRVIGTLGFDTKPNTGNRVVTTSATEATHNIITNNLLGAAALTVSTPTVPNGLTFAGTADDGYWTVTLPFNITYLNQSYSAVYIGTNTYITFGAGSAEYAQLGSSTPALPKIMISANDNSAFRIYRGVEGTTDSATYAVTNSGSGSYTINASSNPTLTLKRGGTYTFNVSASGHPFWIKTAQTTGTGDAYNTGVTNNGTDSGTITFTVPNDAPSTLYYICQYHGSMAGTINVVAGERTFRIRWEGHNSFSGGDTNNPDMIYEATFYEAIPAKIEVHTGVNSRWALEQSNPYPFSVANVDVPLVGTMTVNSGQATLPITVNTAESLEMNVRLGIFPSPSVNITIN